MESILSKIAEYTIEPIGRLLGRQVGYAIHCKTNLQKLKDQVEELKAAREATENQVAEAERKGERIQPDVELWLTKVNLITARADALLNDESQAKLKCLHGFCPNLTVRHQLSRNSAKLVEEAVEHYRKRGLIPKVSCGILRRQVWGVTTRDYHAFQSWTSLVNKIMDHLKDSKTERMGVCGIGGVGKTTLVKEIYKQALEVHKQASEVHKQASEVEASEVYQHQPKKEVSKDKKLFDDVVILLDVKKDPNLEAIQKIIVDQLGMEIRENETKEGRACDLCGRIQGKNVLVILDDVQEKIDLEALGLPRLPTCKILLTCRTPQVFDEMGVDKVFQLDLLDKEDTWNLFVKMAGDVINQNSGIRDVAIKVAERCGGLPLLVVTVASALKHKNKLPAWKDALRRLKEFDKEELTEKVYLGIEWSYYKLDDEELKPLFLLCGVIVKQSHIYDEDLLKYGMGLGLFKNVNTMEEAENALDSLLEKLKDSCLLLDSNVDGMVRMHDLVCHVAKRVAHRDQHVLSVEYAGELKEWPDKDFLRKCTKISLARCKIPPLPVIPLECPELELFRLGGGDGESVEIPSNSFREMQKLKVLDLTSMSMPSLPLSLQYLKKLQTLCLDGCMLGDITLINRKVMFPNLSSLVVHRCNGLRFMLSSSTARSLIYLNYLEITECQMMEEMVYTEQNGEEITGNMFPQLQYLKLKGLPNLAKFCSASYVEFPSLTRLQLERCAKLETFISHPETVVKYLLFDKKVMFPNLSSLVIHRCNGLRFMLSSSTARSLIYLKHLEITECQMMEEIVYIEQYGEEITGNMFPQLQYLKLKGLPNLAKFCSASYIEFPSLTRLQLERCAKLETFISHPETVVKYLLFDKKVGFPKLERLTINDLPKLTKIWGSQLSENSFCKLRDFTVQQCNSLINIVPDSIARDFRHLQTLTVENCGVLEEIVAEEVGETLMPDQFVLFPKLTCLEFRSLPQLKRFYPRMHALNWPLLKTLELFDCRIVDIFASEFSVLPETPDLGGLRKQPFVLIEKSSFPNLEDLTLGSRDMWYGPPGPAAFCKQAVFPGISSRHTDKTNPHLKTLRLYGMEKLMLWEENTESAGAVFLQLKTLEVKFCGLNNIVVRNFLQESDKFRSKLLLATAIFDNLLSSSKFRETQEIESRRM